MEEKKCAVKIIIFGDSILKGVRYEDGSYQVERSWQQAFSEKFGVAIENYSRFGNTIGKAMQTLRRVCEKQAAGREIALLELGGNDCNYNWSEISADLEGVHHCRTIPEHFTADYREAISLLRNSGREPVVLTLPPILPDRYLDHLCSRGLSRENVLKWLGNVEDISMWQHTYSWLVRQIAREEHVRLIDQRLKYPAEARDLESLIGLDGIHPSLSGQKLIFDVLCDDAGTVLAS